MSKLDYAAIQAILIAMFENVDQLIRGNPALRDPTAMARDRYVCGCVYTAAGAVSELSNNLDKHYVVACISPKLHALATFRDNQFGSRTLISDNDIYQFVERLMLELQEYKS